MTSFPHSVSHLCTNPLIHVVPPRLQRLASTLLTLLRQAGISCFSVSTTKSYILLWPGFGSYFLKVNASKLQGTVNERTHTHTIFVALTCRLEGPSSAKQGGRGPMYRVTASSIRIWATRHICTAPETWHGVRCSRRSNRTRHSRRGCHRRLVALGAPTSQHSAAMRHERQQSKLQITYRDCLPLSRGFQEFLHALGASEGVLKHAYPLLRVTHAGDRVVRATREGCKQRVRHAERPRIIKTYRHHRGVGRQAPQGCGLPASSGACALFGTSESDKVGA